MKKYSCQNIINQIEDQLGITEVNNDHKKVSEEIQKINNINWIVSYDNTPAIKKLYAESKKKEYSFFHTAYEIREGKEILFFSKGLEIPRVLEPTKM